MLSLLGQGHSVRHFPILLEQYLRTLLLAKALVPLERALAINSVGLRVQGAGDGKASSRSSWERWRNSSCSLSFRVSLIIYRAQG